ncbi:Bug family tripartite tricarboxylate transporter substrate binding protein [Pseudoroseomonas cervicalis]|uniref:Bug family tripartite tricarboxylate transporter substrate binding protein n=1 Tax=Teichococcus cervicalis TaxID=204525 RepID=UPI0035E91BAC
MHPTHLKRRALLGGALLAAPMLAPRAAWSQENWPTRPIRVVVPFGAGTSTDIMTRLVSTRMSQILGQPLVVENRAGAGGVVGSDGVAKSAPRWLHAVHGQHRLAFGECLADAEHAL